MGIISAAMRHHLPSDKFGIPSRDAYPMPDKEHAANAKARARQELDAGNLSQGQYDHIVSMANAILGEK